MKKFSKKATADLELIAVIKGNDKKLAEKAFKSIFDKYYNSVLNRFKSKIKDNETAEDLTMEVFAKVSLNINKFNPELACFSTWLFKIVENVFVDNFRKKKLMTISLSENSKFDSDNDNEFKIEDELEKSPEEIFVNKERDKNISKIILSIKNPDFVKIIELSFFLDLSYQEIAVIMNKPLGTIKANLYRAKQLVKMELEKNNIK